MRDFVPQLAVGFGVVLAFALLNRAARRAGPLEASPTGGRIGPGRTVLVMLFVSAAAFCLGGAAGTAYGFYTGDSVLAVTSIFLVLFGLSIVWVAVIATSPGSQIVWNADGVRGPAKGWSFSRVPEEAVIPWGAIVRLEELKNGNCYVEAANGARVYWSRYYAGYDVFEEVLFARRPDLRP